MPATEVPDEVNTQILLGIFISRLDNILDWEAKNDIINNPQPGICGCKLELIFKQFFRQKIDTSQISTWLNFDIKSISYLLQFIACILVNHLSIFGNYITFGRLINAGVYIIAIFYFISLFVQEKKFLLFVSLLPMMIQQSRLPFI